MSHNGFENRVKAFRLARGWSQQLIAARSGISRAGVSAIETGRLVPSAAAALALAAAFECRVEDLFSLAGHAERPAAAWAWEPTQRPCRYWLAEVFGRTLRIPAEMAVSVATAHDGVGSDDAARETPTAAAVQSLVMASCDPGAGLLAVELWRQTSVRLIVAPRSSRQALALLREQRVHVAGVHLAVAEGDDGNAAVVAWELGADYRLLRGADWEEGLALARGAGVRTLSSALRRDLRWVGREAGSGARQCQDELCDGRRAPKRVARDHRGVAEALRAGWADAGVCHRFASEEAGLDFLSVRREAYDMVYPKALDGDPRLQALVRLVRSPAWRSLLADLPGYDSTRTGEVGQAG